MCLGMGLLVVAGSLFVQVILEGSKKPNENRHLSKTSIKISPKKKLFPQNSSSTKSNFSSFIKEIVNTFGGYSKHMDVVFSLNSRI